MPPVSIDDEIGKELMFFRQRGEGEVDGKAEIPPNPADADLTTASMVARSRAHENAPPLDLGAGNVASANSRAV